MNSAHAELIVIFDQAWDPCFEHPPYISHLATCDFVILPKLKEALKELGLRQLNLYKKVTETMKFSFENGLKY